MGRELSEEVISKILKYLRVRGCVMISELEDVLGMSRSEVELVLGLLLSQGIISEVKGLHPCSVCSLASGCILKYSSNVRVYRVGR